MPKVVFQSKLTKMLFLMRGKLIQNEYLTRLQYIFNKPTCINGGGGAMVLGKLPVPGRPTIWIQ